VKPSSSHHSDPESQNPEGRPASEEEFVAELTANQSAILALLISLMPGDSAVDDVLQQTNITLWRKRETFRSGSNFRAWAFECAKWTLRAHLKERGRKSWLVVDEELTRAVTERMIARIPDQPGEIRNILQACLGKLRARDRDLLLKYYADGNSLQQCAALVGRSASSLKVTFFRLRVALRRCISGRLAVDRFQL